MISIQCTKKLLKEVGQEHKDAFIPTVPLGCWHANLLFLDRRKCVLFTNDQTRYSLLVPGLRKPDFIGAGSDVRSGSVQKFNA